VGGAFLSGEVLWLRPIGSSFWEDELVTWWVIDGSFREMLHRSYALLGQGALYYPLAWLVRHVSDKEWVLRLPSVIALVGAYLLFLLATRLLDRELGRLAVLVFVLWPGIAFEASNARGRTRSPCSSPSRRCSRWSRRSIAVRAGQWSCGSR